MTCFSTSRSVRLVGASIAVLIVCPKRVAGCSNVFALTRSLSLRWPRLVGQLGGLFKVYSYCHSYRQNLLGQIFLSLLLRL